MVNALSKSLVANIKDGFEYEQRYRQGTPITKVEELKAARGTAPGSPFNQMRRSLERLGLDAALIKERLQISAFLKDCASSSSMSRPVLRLVEWRCMMVESLTS